MDKLYPLVAILFSGAVLFAGCATSQPAADVPLPANTKDLVAALRTGGLNIYLRHSITDKSRLDQDLVDIKNCEQQRNLSEAGREEARQVGQAMRKLGVEVSQVIASPYCRCIDTAELAFNDYQTEPLLRNLDDANKKDRQQRITWLLQHLRQEPQPGANVIYVAHQFNIMAAANILLGEAESAIIRPHGDQGLEVLATLSAAQWRTLARQYVGAP